MRVDELNGIKVGDKIITIKETDDSGCRLFPVGTVGTVIQISSGAVLPYEVEARNRDGDWDRWNYSRDMFIPLVSSAQTNEECIMAKTIEELKLIKDKIKRRSYYSYPNDENSRVALWSDICDVVDESISSMVTRCVKTVLGE